MHVAVRQCNCCGPQLLHKARCMLVYLRQSAGTTHWIQNMGASAESCGLTMQLSEARQLGRMLRANLLHSCIQPDI